MADILTIFKGMALNLLTVQPVLIVVVVRAHFELV